MSSKKQLRREKRQKERAGRRGGPSNATIFILVIVAALLAVGIGAALLSGGDGADAGQVWSVEHGHWH